MLRPLRLKSGMLRPLRLKMGMLRLCATEIFAQLQPIFRQVKNNMLRFCATNVICATSVRNLGSRFALYDFTESTKNGMFRPSRYILTDLA